MLKIRDDFNLEDLKKYGFRKTMEYGSTYIKEMNLKQNVELDDYCDINESFNVSILVNPINVGARHNQVVVYFNNDWHIDGMKPDDIDAVTLPNDLDVLYDLIQDGIIIKEE